ncbi:MAG: hypothetical protein HZA54_16660 [Planctomycetes bacterium]|nr:hypothetical protein [Planctomycetota bacterium]
MTEHPRGRQNKVRPCAEGAIAEAALPPLYASWLRAITGGPIPAETNATCDNCAMLPSPGSSLRATYFHPATKCCAFQPSLPNYLAGGILSDPDPAITEGRKELEIRISRRVAVSPGSALVGSVFTLLYNNTPNVFGRAPDLRCHFLSPTGGCGIRQHRPGVCATWFCKHVRGNTGWRFWRLAHELLLQVEEELSLWCLAELHLGSPEAIEQESAPHVSELGGEIDWAQYRALWGEWAGRELEFYRACAERVLPLTWDQVAAVCGPRVRILAGLLRDAYAGLMADAIPERLRLKELSFSWVEGHGYRVSAYSGFDPLVMSEALARTLRYFDGRPTGETLDAILREQGVRLPLSLVRRMVDFGLLEAHSEKGALPVVG